jgi:hypothetical protein
MVASGSTTSVITFGCFLPVTNDPGLVTCCSGTTFG